MTMSLPAPGPRPGRRALGTALIVGVTTVWLVWTMSPWTWFIDSTPTGGDMGAHVWSPKFLRDELLPNLRLTGWSPDWYAGFPAFTFYMITPSLAIVLVDVGLDFGIGPFAIDSGFYAFVGLVLAGFEIGRRLRLTPVVRTVTMVAAAATSIVFSWRYDGRRFNPDSVLPWSPIEPFTYNDTSMDLAVSALVLPAAVGSLAHHLARDAGRWRGPITAAAVIATILVVPVPYGVAMKAVAISGIVTLPLAAYAAGRLGGLAYPGPALLAVMTLPFLFDRSYNIYGGNVMSTMAGEFAYSMGLTIAVLYIGVAARGLDTGRWRVLAGLLLALAGLTHLFAAFLAIVATAALFVLRAGLRQVVWLCVVGPIAFLLSAFWVVPFVWNIPYLNDMGWGKERDYVAALWSRGGNWGGRDFLVNQPPLQIFVALAVVGAIVSGFRRVRLGMAFTLTASMFAAAFILLPESRLWNVRILPFYYLSVYFLAGIAIAELSRLVADFLRTPAAVRERRPTAMAGVPAAITAVVVIAVLGFPLRSFPGGSVYLDDNGAWEYGYEWAGGLGTSQINLGPGWMRYNFTGYEGRTPSSAGGGYPEYSHLVATMDRVGQQFGCGRSLWEYDDARLGTYGTPMAPMLLPYWTDGCIGSMEGLYFEASATTPYHFLLQSELSSGPSRAMRDIPYSPLDVAKGVDGLRTMGVRYYMTSTEAALTQTRAEPDLTEIATSGPWVVFLVEGQSVVAGLDHLPVVVDGVDASAERWLVPTVAWWEAGHDTPLVAADGPGEWPRSSLEEMEAHDSGYAAAKAAGDRVLEMRRLAETADDWLPRVESEVAQVDNVEVGVSSIRFDVDRVGTPVLVRVSYFPNWDVAGAEGPYRVSPNLMVVVPTDPSVELTYGRSGIEVFAMSLTVLGLILALFTRRIREPATDSTLWDLGRGGLDLPPRDEVVEGVRTGVVGRAAIDGIDRDIDRHRSAGLRSLGCSLVLLGSTFLLWVVAHGRHDWLVPGGDKPSASLIVFTPAAIGIVILFFAALPTLFEAISYRSMVLRPTMMLAGLAPRARPDRVGPGRFALVGAIATGVDLGLAVGLTEVGAHRAFADLAALALAAVVSLMLHSRVTLRGDELDRWIRKPTVFAAVAVVAGAVDLTLYVALGGLVPLTAKVVALATAAVIRALAHRLVLFRAVRREQDHPVGRPPALGDQRLSVVVPAYREAERIAATVERIRAGLASIHDAGGLEIVVVDDGSPDATADAARAAGADVVVVQPANRGKGAAVRAGVMASHGRVVAFTDADLAYAPRGLLAMLEAIESGWDVVIGNRHDDDSVTLGGPSALRSFGSRVVNMATHIMLLGDYRDTQCGFKAFRSDVARVVLGAGRIDGFAFDVEILHLVERYGLSLRELPVEVVNRETSTVRAVRDGIAVGRDILRIRRIASRGGYPPLPADALPR